MGHALLFHGLTREESERRRGCEGAGLLTGDRVLVTRSLVRQQFECRYRCHSTEDTEYLQCGCLIPWKRMDGRALNLTSSRTHSILASRRKDWYQAGTCLSWTLELLVPHTDLPSAFSTVQLPSANRQRHGRWSPSTSSIKTLRNSDATRWNDIRRHFVRGASSHQDRTLSNLLAR